MLPGGGKPASLSFAQKAIVVVLVIVLVVYLDTAGGKV